MLKKFIRLLKSHGSQYFENVNYNKNSKNLRPHIRALKVEIKFVASVIDSRLLWRLFRERLDSEALRIAIAVSDNSDPLEVAYRSKQIKRTLRQSPKYSLEARISAFWPTKDPRAIKLIEAFQSVSQKHVLDILAVGCRDVSELKLLKKKFPESRVVGLDLVSSDDSIIAGDLQELKMESNLFDLVIASHVLEHIAEPRKAIQECFRILRLGGVLAVEVPTTKHSQNCIIRWEPINDADLWDFGTAQNLANFLTDGNGIKIENLLVEDGPGISRVIVEMSAT